MGRVALAPHLPPAQVTAGAVTALALFASVLVHELGHAWVALRNRIPIRGITLFIFGGVAQIGREPGGPAVELRIAIAGPATSLVLAALFAGAWHLVRGMPVLAAPVIWLARINLAVAVFNLVPGFQLDGGRVARALVWRWTGSLRRASEIASAVGQVVAFGFIGWGILTILSGDAIGGIWITLIGRFLQSAAAVSQAEANLRQMLSDVTVGQTMARDCPRVERTLSLDHVVSRRRPRGRPSLLRRRRG
jgi:Zn-dependent protease